MVRVLFQLGITCLLMHLFAFLVDEMQVAGFYHDGEWKRLSGRLTLLLQHYISFQLQKYSVLK